MLKRSFKCMLFAAILIMTGCVRENIDECTPGVNLHFYYTLNPEYKNLFGAQVKKVTVFVFDKNGYFVDSFSYEGARLNNDYVMNLPLKAGTYTIVTWGGYLNKYTAEEIEQTALIDASLRSQLVKGVSTLDNFKLLVANLDSVDQELVVSDLDDLYAGFLTQIVTASDNPTNLSMEIKKLTHNITIVFNGLENMDMPEEVMPTKSINNDPSIYITCKNGRYNWDYSIDQTETHNLKYVPYASSVMGNTMEAKIKVLRLVQSSPMILDVVNPATNEIIFEGNLMDIIKQNPNYVTQDDFDREDQYRIEINYVHKDKDIIITITVNDWEVINVDPIVVNL